MMAEARRHRNWSVGPCGERQLKLLSQMLSNANLPVEDLTAGKLSDFLLAQDQDGCIGAMIGLERVGDAGLLRSLVVDPTFRHQGLGRLLVDAIEAHARNSGIVTMYLLTDTAEDYFPKLGYGRVERNDAPPGIRQTSEFKDLCPESAVCLAKNLVEQSDDP